MIHGCLKHVCGPADVGFEGFLGVTFKEGKVFEGSGVKHNFRFGLSQDFVDPRSVSNISQDQVGGH